MGMGLSAITINEVNFGTTKWIELYNSDSKDVSLSNIKLILPQSTVELSGVIEAGNFYLVSQSDIGGGSRELVSSEVSFDKNGGFLILKSNDKLIDYVCWGDINQNWYDSYPFLWSFPIVITNSDISRVPDGRDTDTPGDFKGTNSPTPLSPNQTMGLDPVSWSRIKALFHDAHKHM